MLYATNHKGKKLAETVAAFTTSLVAQKCSNAQIVGFVSRVMSRANVIFCVLGRQLPKPLNHDSIGLSDLSELTDAIVNQV